MLLLPPHRELLLKRQFTPSFSHIPALSVPHHQHHHLPAHPTPSSSLHTGYQPPTQSASQSVSHLKCYQRLEPTHSHGPGAAKQTPPRVLGSSWRNRSWGGEWDSDVWIRTESGRHVYSSSSPFTIPFLPAQSHVFVADTMGCCSGRCTLIFICTLQLVSSPILLYTCCV